MLKRYRISMISFEGKNHYYHLPFTFTDWMEENISEPFEIIKLRYGVNGKITVMIVTDSTSDMILISLKWWSDILRIDDMES